MTGVGSEPRDLEEFIRDSRKRLVSLERRQGGAGGNGGGGSGGEAVFAAGLVSSWSGPASTIPSGWVLCDGRALLRAAFPALFAAIGIAYGAGDGSTTFNVPNGKGRFIAGQDTTQVEFDVVGESGGAKTHRHNFRFGLFDKNWTASGPNAGMNGTGVADDNDRMGAFRYSDGKFAGGISENLSGNQLSYNSVIGGSNALGQLGRMYSTGDTDVPTGTTGLPPYIVQNWIISTGAGSTPPVAAVLPVDLWQEFTLNMAGSLVQPTSGGGVVWNGTVSGNLGATLAADKVTISLPSAGTYRIITHIGYGVNPGVASSGALYIAGTELPQSYSYGVGAPSAVYVADVENTITVTGPTTFTQGAQVTNGVYRWSWLRIEKVGAFYPTSTVLAVTQGSTALRDSIYGVPGTDATKQASLANRAIVWYNTDKGWFESYYAVTGTAGLTVVGLLSASVAGWYPTGQSLYLQVQRTTQQATNGTYADVTFDLVRTARGITFTVPASTITLPFGGVYEFNLSGVVSQSPAGYLNLALVVAGTTYVAESGTQFPHTNAYSRSVIDYIMTVAGTTSASMRIQSSSAGNLEGNSGRMSVKYLGPPLAN